MTSPDSVVQLKIEALRELRDIFASSEPIGALDGKARSGVQWMRERQFMSIQAPRSFGGSGVSVAGACDLIAAVANLSGSLGLIYAMHLSQALTLINHCKSNNYLRRYVSEHCEHQHLIASATSEKGVSGDIFGSICKIRESGDVLSLHKEVPNISYVDEADALLTTALHHKDPKKQALILVKIASSEVNAGFTGSFIGMKGIFNASYSIDATFPKEAIFDEYFPSIARTTMTTATQIMWAAVWSGIANSAIEKAKTFIRKELKNSPDTQKEMNVQLSELVNKQFTINSLIRESIRDYETSGENEVGLQTSARINRLKIISSQLVNEICFGALSICGLRGYSLSGPYSLAAEIGDALSAPLMVSNFRLQNNNAAIEYFVDESLQLSGGIEVR